ncbi:callose synthase [Trifolium repens]|nr:callose synthase [Trifolium repens]
MRNLLQEFLKRQGRRPPTILGLREHILTGSVSSLAWFMSYQETSFVTISKRLLVHFMQISHDLNNKRFVFHKMVTAGSMGVNVGNQNWVPTDDVGNDTPRTNERGDNANAHFSEQAGKQIAVSTTLIGDQSGHTCHKNGEKVNKGCDNL